MLHNALFAMILTAAVAYLFGSFNSSIVFTRIFMNKDVRDIGSGNAGFTNSMRTGSAKVAVLTLIGDIVKVGLAVLCGRLIMMYSMDGAAGSWTLGAYISGFFAMIGHMFPIYFGFRGGKGVVTLASMLLFADWRVCLISVAIWGVIVAISKMVSLAVIITLPLCALTAYLFRPDGVVDVLGADIPIAAITVGTVILMAVIIIFMHRSNIKRILNGTENKLGQKKKEEPKSEE